MGLTAATLGLAATDGLNAGFDATGGFGLVGAIAGLEPRAGGRGAAVDGAGFAGMGGRDTETEVGNMRAFATGLVCIVAGACASGLE